MREKMVSELRLVDRLTVYWRRLKKDDPLPKVQKINSAAISDIWDNCFIVKIEGTNKTRQFLYEYFGDEIKKAYGKNLSGSRVSACVKNIPGAKVLKHIDKCIIDRNPQLEHGSFVNNDNKTVKYRSCILPFCSKSNGDVTHILVGLSWRAF